VCCHHQQAIERTIRNPLDLFEPQGSFPRAGEYRLKLSDDDGDLQLRSNFERATVD